MTRQFTPTELYRGETVPALKSGMTADDYCRDHDETMPCPQCTSDASFNARMIEMGEWEQRAQLADSMVVNGPEDRRALADWSAYCRKRAAVLNGELMAEVDAEARDLDSLCGVGGELMR